MRRRLHWTLWQYARGLWGSASYDSLCPAAPPAVTSSLEDFFEPSTFRRSVSTFGHIHISMIERTFFNFDKIVSKSVAHLLQIFVISSQVCFIFSIRFVVAGMKDSSTTAVEDTVFRKYFASPANCEPWLAAWRVRSKSILYLLSISFKAWTR